MTSLFGIQFNSLPHVNIYKWAADKKIFLPLDFRKTPEQEKVFLKYLSLKHHFVRLPADQEQARFSEALKEAIKYLPSKGLSDKIVISFQIAGTIFFAVLCVMKLTSKL